MTYEIEYAYTCHMGKLRGNNEDNFWCRGAQLPAENTGAEGVCTARLFPKERQALAVFDGMGGESCGEMAAFLAAQELGVCIEDERRSRAGFWSAACRRMNEAVCRYCRENKLRSMGTTLAAVRFLPEEIQACNLGDSRIYRFFSGELTRLSKDHVAGGGFLGKPPLTQYLGIQEEELTLEPVLQSLPYEEGAHILLCSDGMTDMLSDTEIRGILEQGLSVEETVRRFLERALEKGGRDNITIVLCRIMAGTKKSFWTTAAEKIRKYLGDKR